MASCLKRIAFAGNYGVCDAAAQRYRVDRFVCGQSANDISECFRGGFVATGANYGACGRFNAGNRVTQKHGADIGCNGGVAAAPNFPRL